MSIDDFANDVPARAKTDDFAPSAYQQAIFDDTERGDGHVVVRARAGSGKTTTILRALSRVPARHQGDVVLLAFNSDIAKELKARAVGADVMTLHSYGFRAVIRAWGRKPDVDAYKVQGLARELVGDGRGTGEWHAALKRAVSMAKNTLVESPAQIDMMLDARGIDVPPLGGDPGAERATFIGQVGEILGMCREESASIDFDDQCWLPVVNGYRTRPFGRVFVDELQDLNAVQLRLSLGAAKRGGRIVGVGDDRQCHPAGVLVETAVGKWMPIEKLRNGDEIQSWNRNAQKMVGGRRVRVASRPYAGKLHTIEAGGHEVPMTPNHRLICRWTDRTADVFVTYLMWRNGFGFRVGWCKLFAVSGRMGGSGKSNGFHLAHRARIEKADRVWILKAHESRTEASAYESIVAARYGLPTATFEPVHGAQHLTEKTIAHIFEELANDNMERGMKALDDHDREFGLPIYPWPGQSMNVPQGRRTYFEVYAANAMPGLMFVPLPDSQNAWTPISRNGVTDYSGRVYSLDVAEDHSYVANGVVVLNSIYAFRGADAGAMPRTIKELGARVLPLSVCYRCASSIVDEARALVPDIEAAPGARRGEVRTAAIEKLRREAAPGDFVISRTNAPLMHLCLEFLRQGRRAVMRGRDVGDSLAAFVRRARAEGSLATPAFVDHVERWRDHEVARLAAKERDTTEASDKAECLLAIAEGARDLDEIERRVASLFTDDNDESRIILTSAHRAKGKERERAWLLRDTFRPQNGGQEANLLYVAQTRAKGTLAYVTGMP